MGGHYEKDMYKQFCELADRLNSLEKGSKQDRKEIKRLNKEVDRVNKRNTVLEKKLARQDSSWRQRAYEAHPEQQQWQLLVASIFW